MIDEYGIDNQRDKSQRMKKGNIRVSNKEFTNRRLIRNSNRLSGTNTNFVQQVQSTRRRSVGTGKEGPEIMI
jgi:hypothetical protein